MVPLLLGILQALFWLSKKPYESRAVSSPSLTAPPDVLTLLMLRKKKKKMAWKAAGLEMKISQLIQQGMLCALLLLLFQPEETKRESP